MSDAGRVLITGAGGQLGLDLCDEFADRDPVTLPHEQLDVSDRSEVSEAIAHHRPDVVINAAAWTDVDGCESDPAKAHAVNALGPWWLARACNHIGAKLVTYSTDYVFDGTVRLGPGGRPRGFTEFDLVSPINAYGRSKAAGENLVREALDDHHIVRTSWVCGSRGGNFVRTMVRLAKQGEPLKVVDDQFGCPTFTRDLAGATRRLVEGGLPGTVNITNRGSTSWYEFATEVFRVGSFSVDLSPQSSSDLDRPAPRPAWSVLDATHATAIGVGPLPDWRASLARLVGELGPSG